MLHNLIVLPDGTELFSGAGTTNAIKSLSVTECVNSGAELTLGSTCSAMVEATIIAPEGGLTIDAGSEFTLYKLDTVTGDRYKVGIFTAEKPVRSSANTYKVTAYDHVAMLDKDLAAHFAALDALIGWPVSLHTLAGFVCLFCQPEGVNLPFVTEEFPNMDYMVEKPDFGSSVTGRQIMQWIGELAGCFFRANADGEIEAGWYAYKGVSIAPTGERYFFQSSLKYEDYNVASVEAVQIRLADSDTGALFPTVSLGTNAYVLSSNKLIRAADESILDRLQVVQERLANAVYRPCRVAVPASMDIRAGDIVEVTDANDFTFRMYVMTKTQKGQRDILECTGSPRRDSPSVVNNPTNRDLKDYADEAAGSALRNQTAKQVFDRLTGGGEVQGLYMDPETGQIYINVEYLRSGKIVADIDVASVLQSADGGETFMLDAANKVFRMTGSGKFQSADKKSYITMEGDEIVMYTLNESGSAYADKIRIGVQTDLDGASYPYIKLGASEDPAKIALIEKFYNGVWVGNGAPFDTYGYFQPKTGYYGTFVDVDVGEVYAVRDGEMRALFDGDITARFA